MSASDAISPTALYTGQVWLRNGLSHPALGTVQGRLLFDALQPVMRIGGALGGPSLEDYLLARHRAIDALLERAIERDGVTQVLEVAAGMSPRGWRFVSRYGDRLTYLEGDLPAMAGRKRRALAEIGSLSAHHRVLDLDGLRDDGRTGLPAVAAELDPGRPAAIITEGLLGYLGPDDMRGLWRRFAGTLERFPSGRYISDLHLGSAQDAAVRAFRVALSAFVRGRVYLHFDTAAEAEAELLACGFSGARVLPAWQVCDRTGDDAGRDRGAVRAHILEASTG
ncbi:MAG: class I SAM-dependent methyltransferase [Solirubrobacteraceae bacterium]